jgi:hypothetical protein
MICRYIRGILMRHHPQTVRVWTKYLLSLATLCYTPHKIHGEIGRIEVLGLPHPYMTSGLYKHVHVLLPQIHGVRVMILRVSQDTDWFATRVAHNSHANTNPATMTHLSRMDLGQLLRRVVDYVLSLSLLPRTAQCRTTSPLSQRTEGTGRGRAPPSTSNLIRAGMPHLLH